MKTHTECTSRPCAVSVLTTGAVVVVGSFVATGAFGAAPRRRHVGVVEERLVERREARLLDAAHVERGGERLVEALAHERHDVFLLEHVEPVALLGSQRVVPLQLLAPQQRLELTEVGRVVRLPEVRAVRHARVQQKSAVAAPLEHRDGEPAAVAVEERHKRLLG